MNICDIKLNMKLKNIIFKKVSISDADFLFELLKFRNSKNNISHKKMPSFLEHVNFIKKNNYANWYVIFLNKEKIGSIYLTKINEIGLHLKNEFEKNKVKKDELEKIILNKLIQKHPKNRYLVNVNPKNKNRIMLLKKYKFELLQYTFELNRDGK